MKRKRKTKSVRLAVILGILSALLVEHYSSPEPDRVIFDPPKQPHHVIYVYMCGVLEGIILTTEPYVQYADWIRHMTPEMTELETEALAHGRAFSFTVGLWVTCAEPFPENLDVIQRDES